MRNRVKKFVEKSLNLPAFIFLSFLCLHYVLYKIMYKSNLFYNVSRSLFAYSFCTVNTVISKVGLLRFLLLMNIYTLQSKSLRKSSCTHAPN